MLDRPVPEPVLDGARVVALVGKRVPAPVAQHVSVYRESDCGDMKAQHEASPSVFGAINARPTDCRNRKSPKSFQAKSTRPRHMSSARSFRVWRWTHVGLLPRAVRALVAERDALRGKLEAQQTNERHVEVRNAFCVTRPVPVC